jgi:gluconokinase
VLVLDIGSSSTRALLCDASAAVVSESLVREKSALRVAPDGTAVDDPQDLLGRVVRCIDEVLARAGTRATQIVAVGCATYAANLIGLGADGTPGTPVFTYADTRSAPVAEALRRRLDETTILQRTGCPLRSSYLPALFAWLADTHPDLLRMTRRWLSIGEWLFEQFFGRSTISYSLASWSGLLNRVTHEWDAELLAELPVSADQLGTLAEADTAFVGLRDEWARRWPSLAAIPWFSPVGDGAAANIGSGCIGPNRIALSIGTTGALRVLLPSEPLIPQGLWRYCVDRERPLLGGATSEGGNVLTWALATLRLQAAELDRYLHDPAGAQHGLTVLPFLVGERSPGWRGDVRATISGIALTTSTLDVARAALEGVTYRWARIAELLRTVVPGTPMVVASGGALKHMPSWAQLIADVLGLPLTLSAETETTSRGVALLALRSLGRIDDLGAIPAALGPTLTPDPERFAAHQVARACQADLYDRLG